MRYLLLVLLFSPIVASAECVCSCVNGHVQALCRNAIDLRPVCVPRICPIVPPSIQPLTAPIVPPIGTNKCVPKQVWNPFARMYEWRLICS